MPIEYPADKKKKVTNADNISFRLEADMREDFRKIIDRLAIDRSRFANEVFRDGMIKTYVRLLGEQMDRLLIDAPAGRSSSAAQMKDEMLRHALSEVSGDLQSAPPVAGSIPKAQRKTKG